MSGRKKGAVVRAGVAAAWANLGAVTWRYVASLVSALPFALAFGLVVDGYFAKSLTAETFAAGVDLVLLVEFALANKDALVALVPVLAGGVILWSAISAFLTGGVLSTVAADHPLRTNELFAAGGRGFGRLMRLLPFGAVFTVVALVLPAVGLFALHHEVTESWVSERGVVATRLAVLLLVVLLFAWANGAYDLMKVEAVAHGEHRARYAFWRGLVRAAKAPISLVVVYLAFVVVAVVVTLAASLIDVRLARTGAVTIAAAFVLQQATAYVRAFVSVALAGAEVTMSSRER